MKLIDKDYFLEKMKGIYEEYMYDVLEEVPIVDAVPVVRCKDCRHWLESKVKNYGQCDCDALMRDAEFFCKSGEGKDDV